MDVINVLNTAKPKLRRMRTIRQALAEIKEIDPNTGLNYNYVNKLCEENKIHNIIVGQKKRLLDLDELLNYFMNGD
jgi:hypothetical protein